MVLAGDELFDTASSTIKDPSALSGVLQEAQRPNARVHIDGYTDNVPITGGNQALSERRARSVATYLEQNGVPADRITWAGHGEASPYGDNSTAEGRAQNRRVEVTVTED